MNSGCGCRKPLRCLHGVPQNPWVSGKDLVLFLINQIGDDGALYQALEYHGEAIAALSVEAA